MANPYTAPWGSSSKHGDKPLAQKFSELGEAIRHENWEELLPYAEAVGEPGPMIASADPVLSLLITHGKSDLAIKLIEKLPREKLMTGNFIGDTALHVAVTKGDESVANALVKKNGDLLWARNKQKEIPLHQAAQFGRKRIFWNLMEHVPEAKDARTKDGATILHCAVTGNAPDLALEIAMKYPEQMMTRNVGAITPLQLVMIKPEAFRSQSHLGPLGSLIYYWIPSEESSDEPHQSPAKVSEEPHASPGLRLKDEECQQFVRTSQRKIVPNYATCVDALKLVCTGVRWARQPVCYNLKRLFTGIQYLENLKKNQEQTMQLIAYLASDPNYWEFIDMGRIPPDESKILSVPHFKTSESNENPPEQRKEPYRWNESPLILGAKMGLSDYVRQILKVYPPSVRYLDTERRNVLQVAIQYRQEEIIEIIKSMTVQDNPFISPSLFSSVQEGTRNTILHFAVETAGGNFSATQMHHELRWFERVNMLIPDNLKYSRNEEEKTALELFNEKHKEMVKDGQKQLMDMGKTYSGLVAAVVFASSFAVPGEKDTNHNPVFLDKTAFKIFSHAYVIGLSCAATAFVLFLSLFTSSYRVQDFRRWLPKKYLLAKLSFFLAFVSLLVAFICNICLNIYGGRKAETKDIVPLVCELTIFPAVCTFVLLIEVLSLKKGGDVFGV